MWFLQYCFMGARHHSHRHTLQRKFAPSIEIIERAEELMTFAANKRDVAWVRLWLIVYQGEDVCLPKLLLLLRVGGKVHEIFYFFLVIRRLASALKKAV